MKDVQIYTDGACLGNPGPGGWAALLVYVDSQQQRREKTLAGYRSPKSFVPLAGTSRASSK